MAFTDFLKALVFGASNKVTQAAENLAGQTGIKEIDDIISKWDTLKETVDKIFNPHDPPESDRTWVVTLLDAKMVLEDFRLGALKDRLEANYETIKAAFFTMFHPPAEAAAQAAASDPEVKAGSRILLKIEGAIQTAQFILQQVAKVEDAVIDTVKLFDLVGSEQDKLNDKVLHQRSRPLPTSAPIAQESNSDLSAATM